MNGPRLKSGPPQAELERTKMVCTLGPSSDSPETIRRLVRAGMDVARLNFSHGDHETHRGVFEKVRRVAAEEGANVAVLMDLQGPKIRTGALEGGTVNLAAGDELVIVAGEGQGHANRLYTSYEHLAADVRPGDRLLISDGQLEFEVVAVEGPVVRVTVIRGGRLKEHQGINLPGVRVTAPSLTPKDCADLALALDLGADYVALSFVRRAEDLAALRKAMADHGRPTAIVAKIERPEAVEHFDAILDATDAVMVARGDLGVEVELEEVPRLQKELIRRCNERGRPVITATQMLESMITNSRPTRAEVADVANAIYDGTDAVMLSGETAAGKYPVEAAEFMARIAATTDRHILTRAPVERRPPPKPADYGEDAFGHAIGEAAFSISNAMHLTRIVCFTRTGRTAAAIARFRPRVPITAITLSEVTRRRCALIWGVQALKAEGVYQPEDMGRAVDGILLEQGLARPGDAVAITAGVFAAAEGRTNWLKLHRVGEGS
jgi:pyruvate kinase